LDADAERRARLTGSRVERRKADIASGAKLQKVAEYDKEDTGKIFDAAKKKFGITHDVREGCGSGTLALP
jgi:hypothetical protein